MGNKLRVGVVGQPVATGLNLFPRVQITIRKRENGAGAGLLFQYRKHRLSVFIFQDRAEWKNVSAPGTPAQHASFWVETWSAGGLRYFVMGDTSAANVEQLSELMKSAANSK